MPKDSVEEYADKRHLTRYEVFEKAGRYEMVADEKIDDAWMVYKKSGFIPVFVINYLTYRRNQ